jgi:acyl-CoA synthetase (AMP-forming)/AMP-acid ligase II/thioesterase domain-containing protein
LSSLLLRAAADHPGSRFSWLPSAQGEPVVKSYAALLEESCTLLGGLRGKGARPGARIALLLERPEEFIPAFWACVLGGFLPCPLAVIRNDAQRWARHLAHVDALLDGALIVTSGTLKQDVAGLKVVDLEQLHAGEPQEPWDGARPEDAALLVLTSGSTGHAKAVVLTHANLLAAMASKPHRQVLGCVDVSLNWISFDHVAGLIEGHLLPLSLGATQLHVMSSAILSDPLLFLKLIDRARVSLTFTPNFLLGNINAALRSMSSQGRRLGLDLSCVRLIISGGEAIAVKTGERFLELLAPCGLSPRALWPAFGMTETCAGSVYSRGFPYLDAEHEFASLGTPVSGLRMRVVDERDAPLPPGKVGELQVRGPMVFAGYYNNEDATRAAFTADGWFRTGDLAQIEKGVLRLAGRSKDSIIVSGVNYFSHELESAVGELAGVERSFVAAFPFRPPGADTEQLIICFAPAAASEECIGQVMSAVRNTAVLLWGFRPTLILPLPKGAFPKTSLGKIQRSLLRARLEAGEFSQQIARTTAPASNSMAPAQGWAEVAVAEIFGQIFGQAVSATASFFDLGGTSLEILRLKQALERRFAIVELPLMSILQHPTVRELAAHASQDGEREGSEHNPLVLLQPSGSKTPLFCVHPGSGEVLVFVNLATCFAGDRPFYALRARGLGPGERCFGTFQEMVDNYMAAIRSCQPRGPYALAGYSFGAPVAFEIAKGLEAQGEEVGFLASIDGTAYLGDPRARLDAVDCAVILAFFLSLIDREQLQSLPRQLRVSCARHDVHAHLLGMAPPQRLAELDLHLAKFKAWAAFSHTLVQLGESYIPTGTVGSMTVLHAAPLRGTKEEWLGQLQRWDRLTRSPNRYIEVAGEHHTLLDPKNITGLHAALRAEIDRALAGR